MADEKTDADFDPGPDLVPTPDEEPITTERVIRESRLRRNLKEMVDFVAQIEASVWGEDGPRLGLDALLADIRLRSIPARPPSSGKMKVVRLLVIEGDERWVRQTLERSEIALNHPLLVDSNTGMKSIIETERKVLTAEQWHLPIHILLGE